VHEFLFFLSSVDLVLEVWIFVDEFLNFL
jgi:hypothetical protein